MYMRKLSSVRLSGLSKVVQIGKGPIAFSALRYVLSYLYTCVSCVQGCQGHWPLKGFWNVTEIRLLKQRDQGYFPGGPVVENLPSNARDTGWSLVRETKIPTSQAAWPKRRETLYTGFPRRFCYPRVIINIVLLSKLSWFGQCYIVTLCKIDQEQRSRKKLQKELLKKSLSSRRGKASLGLGCSQGLPHPSSFHRLCLRGALPKPLVPSLCSASEEMRLGMPEGSYHPRWPFQWIPVLLWTNYFSRHETHVLPTLTERTLSCEGEI